MIYITLCCCFMTVFFSMLNNVREAAFCGILVFTLHTLVEEKWYKVVLSVSQKAVSGKITIRLSAIS